MLKRNFLLLLVVLLTPHLTWSAQPFLELTSNDKIIYPANFGLPENESLLSLFRTIPGLMTNEENSLSENVSLSVDNEAHLFDPYAVLRRLRIMDVEKIEISENQNASKGIANCGVAVNIVLKQNATGFHGNFSVEGNTNGTLDPTFWLGWANDKWSIKTGASVYLDHTKIKTVYKQSSLTKEGWWEDSTAIINENLHTFGENAYLNIDFKPSTKDVINFNVSQEFIDVDGSKTQESTMQTTVNDDDNQQHNNSFSLGYTHTFDSKAELKATATAKFQDNPHLYGYKFYSYNNASTRNSDVSSHTSHYYLSVMQKIPLWKDASIVFGEDLDWGIINDGSTIADQMKKPLSYDIESFNSQSKVQLRWNVRSWSFRLGEVVDYFRYNIGFTDLPTKSNSTLTPQTYGAIGYQINDKNSLHFSYRTCLTRPNYTQIYPITTVMDANKNFVLQDSLFRSLQDSKGHSLSLGYVYNGEKIALSTSLKTLLIRNALIKVGNVWKNSEKDNYYRLNASLVWTEQKMINTFSASATTLSYKNDDSDHYKNKVSFDLRWMSSFDYGKGWNSGMSLGYTSPQWRPYGKISDYVSVDVHASKQIGKWTIFAAFSDILDMHIIEKTWSDNLTTESDMDLDWRGFSLGASYKF